MQRPSGSTGALTLQPQRRPWLADAAFTVILSWGDLEAIRAALIRPPWPPYLGRTGFLPSRLLAGEFVEGDDLASLARGVVGPREVARVPAVCAAPVPGDVVQMLPGRRDWRTRCHGGASLWTRISIPNEVEIEALPERDAGRLPTPDPTKMACCRCQPCLSERAASAGLGGWTQAHTSPAEAEPRAKRQVVERLRDRWLPFLHTYRTMCIAPEPEFLCLLQGRPAETWVPYSIGLR